MTPFENLVNEVFKKNNERKGFEYKRKSFFKIYDNRINQLYDKYFNNLTLEKDSYSFNYAKEDLEELLFMLRCHFKIWMEYSATKITIYKHFPKQFKIVKDVNKENHWFAPEVFKKGTILFYTKSNYGTVNLLNGIPLSKSLKPIEGTNIIPSTQINYEFIVPIKK